MFNGIANKAKELRDKVDLSQRVSDTKQFASMHVTAGASKAGDLFERHWPKVEHVVVNGLISVAEEKLKDDQFLQSVFESAYELLPTAVRIVLPRTKFIEFSMQRREPILLKLQDFRVARETGSPSP